jgi:hypothetical protein
MKEKIPGMKRGEVTISPLNGAAPASEVASLINRGVSPRYKPGTARVILNDGREILVARRHLIPRVIT